MILPVRTCLPCVQVGSYAPIYTFGSKYRLITVLMTKFSVITVFISLFLTLVNNELGKCICQLLFRSCTVDWFISLYLQAFKTITLLLFLTCLACFCITSTSYRGWLCHDNCILSIIFGLLACSKLCPQPLNNLSAGFNGLNLSYARFIGTKKLSFIPFFYLMFRTCNIDGTMRRTFCNAFKQKITIIPLRDTYQTTAFLNSPHVIWQLKIESMISP